MTRLILIRHGQSVWNAKNIFTGWVDVDLTSAGRQEAKQSGELINKINFKPQICFTSYLKRARDTLDIILKEINFSEDLKINKSWQLNERHYGNLQGLNKDETRKKYGEDQFLKWRRSYDTAPPKLDITSEMNPNNDPLYENIQDAKLPLSECLKDTYERVIPYWEEFIKPNLKNGDTLIAAHGNSLRALCKLLFNISDQDIAGLEIPTGNPLLLELDNSCKIKSASYLNSSRAEKIPQIN
jgi:2,3-bisphosphoglycerate-dependent phosphoglycerate mutase